MHKLAAVAAALLLSLTDCASAQSCRVGSTSFENGADYTVTIGDHGSCQVESVAMCTECVGMAWPVSDGPPECVGHEIQVPCFQVTGEVLP